MPFTKERKDAKARVKRKGRSVLFSACCVLMATQVTDSEAKSTGSGFFAVAAYDSAPNAQANANVPKRRIRTRSVSCSEEAGRPRVILHPSAFYALRGKT